MKTKEVVCAFCQTKFDKSISKIKETEKNGSQHTCNRSCAAKISNVARHAVPATRNAEHTRRDKQRYPERDMARKLVQRAIKAGHIVPPEECEECFSGDVKLEGHHENHFEPYLLSFLCRDCHVNYDRHKFMGLGTDYSSQVPN